jgi:hypothetical protein
MSFPQRRLKIGHLKLDKFSSEKVENCSSYSNELDDFSQKKLRSTHLKLDDFSSEKLRSGHLTPRS